MQREVWQERPVMEPQQPGYRFDGLRGLANLKRVRLPENEKSKKRRRSHHAVLAMVQVLFSVEMVVVGALDHKTCVGNKATLFLIIGGSVLMVACTLRLFAWLSPWPYINDINEKNAGLAEFIFWIIAIWGSFQIFGEQLKKKYLPYLPEIHVIMTMISCICAHVFHRNLSIFIPLYT